MTKLPSTPDDCLAVVRNLLITLESVQNANDPSKALSTAIYFSKDGNIAWVGAAPFVPNATEPMPEPFRMPVGWLLEPEPFSSVVSIATAI